MLGDQTPDLTHLPDQHKKLMLVSLCTMSNLVPGILAGACGRRPIGR